MDERIANPCCDADYKQEGRASYICCECGKDITIEIILIYQALNN